jgi:lysophospholipase L1-like esterase
MDILAARLRAAGKPRSVVNAGISCNALTIGDGNVGPKAADRFREDVVNRAGVGYVIIFEGTNDIYGGQPASAVIAALTTLAARARAAGIKAIGATILPRTDGPIPVKDEHRATVNQWIRTTPLLDGVIDFDAVIRSAANPEQMNPGYGSDNIHPNTRGHIAMGNAIDLSLFDR